MPEPTPEAWAQIRHDYEHTDRPLAHICAEHEITTPMLRYRMKRWQWRRRKPLIPREGPPAVAVIRDEFAAASPLPAPPLPPPAPGEGEEIVPRLQSAVARVLPAIEATIARLAAGHQQPREMEQAARALGTLTRTLRELNALLSQHHARAEALSAQPAHPQATLADDDMPEDIDAFRIELARRIDAFVASQTSDGEEAKTQET